MQRLVDAIVKTLDELWPLRALLYLVISKFPYAKCSECTSRGVIGAIGCLG